jgi:WD40 repeat protein
MMKNNRFIFVSLGILALALIIAGAALWSAQKKTEPAAQTQTPRISEEEAAPPPAVETPDDKKVSVSLGSIVITTYNPVTITGLEYSTNLYFTVKNIGNAPTVVSYRYSDRQTLPDWIFHLYALQDKKVSLAAGEERVLEFMITNEGDGEAELPFIFTIDETGKEKGVIIDLKSIDARNPAGAVKKLPNTSLITGRVTDQRGAPVPGAEVRVSFYNGRMDSKQKTGADGTYRIAVPSIDDLRAAMGSRPLPYRDLDYFATVEASGYAYAYRGGLAPSRSGTLEVNFTLEPVGKTVSYKEIGRFKTEGAYGYGALLPNSGFTRVSAVQFKHPPELHKPGHMVTVDLNANELWRFETGDECWGFDVSVKGSVAAGCHDNFVYLVDKDGSLVWKIDTGGQNREVEFSPHGNLIFTGPYKGSDAAMLDAATGRALWIYGGVKNWLRNARFSSDGKRVVGGFAQGPLVMFDRDGRVLWKNFIGQFPLLFEIDDQYNVYAAGKNREIFSFDGKGNLRWRYRVPNHVVNSGDISRDGKFLVFVTVGSRMYAMDSSGNLLWQRHTKHQTLDMTPDGKWIAVGTEVYRSDGTLVWFLDLPGEAVAISDDGKFIAIGDGGSNIRIFKRHAVSL